MHKLDDQNLSNTNTKIKKVTENTNTHSDAREATVSKLSLGKTSPESEPSHAAANTKRNNLIDIYAIY